MQGLTAERMSRNAYRILGLPGTASQAAIEQAVRRMRIWPDAGRIPATAWDVPWVGELVRSKSELEQALSRLAEPGTRVQERLLWFHRANALLNEQTQGTLDDAAEGLGQSDEIAERHDGSLARYRAAMLLDPEIKETERWQAVVQAFSELSNSDDYLDYLLKVECEGDFEKRAEPEEIANAVKNLPKALLEGLAAKAESALDDEKLEQAGSILRLLRTMDPSVSRQLLDRMEDLIDRRCERMGDELRKEIVFEDRARLHNDGVCRRVSKEYESSIATLVAGLEQLGASETHRVQRVKWGCAKFLSMLATGWIMAGDFLRAHEVLRLALPMALGTSLEIRLREQLAENEPRVQEQRRRSGSIHGSGEHLYDIRTNDPGILGGGKRKILPPKPVYSAPPPLPMRESRSRGKGWVIALVIALVSGAVRTVVTSDHSGSGGGYSTPNLSQSEMYRNAVRSAEKARRGDGETGIYEAEALERARAAEDANRRLLTSPPGGGYVPENREVSADDPKSDSHLDYLQRRPGWSGSEAPQRTPKVDSGSKTSPPPSSPPRAAPTRADPREKDLFDPANAFRTPAAAPPNVGSSKGRR
jgi:hypothetical protein